MEVIYQDYINERKIFNVEESKNLTYQEALSIFISNQQEYDMISFHDVRKLLILNIAVLQTDNNGKYYYDYEFDRDCDIIDNFVVCSDGLNVTLNFIIGHDTYNFSDIKQFLPVASMYNTFKLRIIFNEIPEQNKEITIRILKYVCSKQVRDLLMKNKIITPSIVYYDGVCTKKIVNRK
jgi:hypothetical protein